MREHIYRSYETLGVTICQNCTKFRHEIEKDEHYIFESGYCEPRYCPRCQAENCMPPGLEVSRERDPSSAVQDDDHQPAECCSVD